MAEQAYEFEESGNDEPKPGKRDKVKYWTNEITQSQKMLKKWHKQGNRIVKRFLDDRDRMGTIDREGAGTAAFRLNLFHSNILTLQSMLYGSLPQIDVSRKYFDANDDVARVAAEMMERMLNFDLQTHGDDYDAVLRGTLQDRLLPGLGVARCRYEFEEEEVEVAAVIDQSGYIIQEAYTDTQLVSEEVPVDYFHWQDVLWGWSRSFADIPWIGFRSFLTKDQITQRFGEEVCEELTFEKQKVSLGDDQESIPEQDEPGVTAQIWEIWDKETKKVRWYSQGSDKLLDNKSDPLGLAGFYPCPPFMMANATTSLYKPTPDYHLAQDLYNEVDKLQTRIAIITEAVKVVGVYDASADGVQRMLKEGVENDLIPVDNWAMFGEKGGLRGQIDWLPLEAIVTALDKLIVLRDDTMQLLQQINGMSDVMQGGLSNQYEGTGQTQMKAQFGAVRVQSLQDQFSRFTAQLMQIKAEIITLHFDPQTIVKQSGVQQTWDEQFAQQAVQLLKDPSEVTVRIEVRPETMAMVDYARLKTERTEFINAMSTFLQSAAPLVEQEPATTPFLLQMLQWALAGFKGSSEIEGVMDQAIAAATEARKKAEEEPQEDPGAAEAKAKSEGEIAKIEAKSQADQQLRQQDLQADVQTIQAQSQAKMQEIQANVQAKLMEINAKLQADLQVEQAQYEGNVAQTEAAADSEIMKSAMEAEIQAEADEKAASIKLQEIATGSNAKIEEIVTAHMTSTIEKGFDSETKMAQESQKAANTEKDDDDD